VSTQAVVLGLFDARFRRLHMAAAGRELAIGVTRRERAEGGDTGHQQDNRE
jgi:hypothetical protein